MTQMSSQKTQRSLQKISKVAGYKIKTLNLTVFLYTSNKHVKINLFKKTNYHC